jgi:hypothetical protein
MTPEEWDKKFLPRMGKVLATQASIFRWLSTQNGLIDFQRIAPRKLARIRLPGKVWTDMQTDDFEDWDSILREGAERIYRVLHKDPRIEKR